MTDSICITYTWTDDDLIAAYRWHFRHTCRFAFRVGLHFIFALMLLLGVFTLIRSNGSSPAMCFAFGFAGLYWFFLRPFERRRMIRRQFAKRPDKDSLIEWRFSDERVEMASPLGKAETRWEAYSKAVFPPMTVMLYPNDQIFHYLPERAFSTPGQYDQLASLIRSKITRTMAVS